MLSVFQGQKKIGPAGKKINFMNKPKNSLKKKHGHLKVTHLHHVGNNIPVQSHDDC